MKNFIRWKYIIHANYMISIVLSVALLTGCVSIPPLHQAAVDGNVTEVQSLLSQGGDANERFQRDNSTPIHWSSVKGNNDVIETLIASGADINAQDGEGYTALMAGKLTTVQLLLDHSADINTKTKSSNTVLDAAVGMEHNDIIKVLIDNGADANTKDKEGWTILMTAVAMGNEEIVKTLITHGADVNAKTTVGMPVLFVAKKYKHENIIKILEATRAN